MRKPTVVFYAAGSYVAGVEIATLTIMKSLARSGGRVHALISGWNDGEFINLLEASGIEFTPIKLGKLHKTKPLWTLDTILNYPAALLRARKTLKSLSVDFLVVPNLSVARAMARIMPKGCKLVLQVHDVPSAEEWHRNRKFLSTKAPKVLAVSQFIKDKIDQVWIGEQGKDITIVYNSVEVPHLANFLERRPIERIGIVGQIIPRKRHVDAIVALTKLPHTIRLEVYGEGPEAQLENLKEHAKQLGVSNRITWHGYVADLDELYRSIDALVVPAQDEPFGMTLIEAASRGIPIVASRSGAFPEIIVDEVSGLLFEPRSPASLASAIKKLLARDNSWDLVVAAKTKIQDQFSSERSATRFLRAVSDA